MREIDETAPLLSVKGLSIDYATRGGRLRVVDEVAFDIAQGEILGLVGESGSGKSTLLLSLLGYVKQGGTIAGGTIDLEGRTVLGRSARALAQMRGRVMGFVPQNPAGSLSPHMRIIDQMVELVLWHRIARSRDEAKALAIEELGRLGLPGPEILAQRYPHQLSGGQQQRVCIAMAVITKPKLLLLDEPTTGLDVTTQARVIRLLIDLRERLGMAMLYVTHDLGVVAQLADKLGVMYAGHLVEIGRADTLFDTPQHPYTRGLIGSAPSMQDDGTYPEPLQGLLRREALPPGCSFAPRCSYSEESCFRNVQSLEPAAPRTEVACQRWRTVAAAPHPAAVGATGETRREVSKPLLELQDLSVDYRPIGQQWKGRATIPPLNLVIRQGELLSLVGESGSGKSTIARAISGLVAPSSGQLVFRGEAVPAQLKRRTLQLRREIQLIFQNPDASLNPRSSIRGILARPLRAYFSASRREIDARSEQALADVSLDSAYADRYPGQLSGGEKQRIAIARALVARPSILLCDEILSALDVSVQANIIALIDRLRGVTGVTVLFISHDLAVVRKLSDRIAVLYRGEIVEIGPAIAVFSRPQHPYTSELIRAAPDIHNRGKARRPVEDNLADGSDGHPLHDPPPWTPSDPSEELPGWQTAGPDHFFRSPRPPRAPKTHRVEPRTSIGRKNGS